MCNSLTASYCFLAKIKVLIDILHDFYRTLYASHSLLRARLYFFLHIVILRLEFVLHSRNGSEIALSSWLPLELQAPFVIRFDSLVLQRTFVYHSVLLSFSSLKLKHFITGNGIHLTSSTKFSNNSNCQQFFFYCSIMVGFVFSKRICTLPCHLSPIQSNKPWLTLLWVQYFYHAAWSLLLWPR